MKRFRHLVACTSLALTGCATAVITPEVETELGYEMAQQVQNQIGLYQEPALQAYVAGLGQRLVNALGPTPYTFRFAIVDQFEPNAFATPGGFIYVSRGLLAQINSEAELAGVLAHEISHVTQRHHARQVGRSVSASLFTLPGKAVGMVSEDLGNLINTPIERAGQVYLSKFSRSQETEADRYGMQLAASAGYDPMALAGALQGIERAVTALTGEQHEASFFDSHPTTPTRVADIAEHADAVTVSPTEPLADKAALLTLLDGLWWGPQNPQQGLFVDQTYLNADMNVALTFPDNWDTVNTPRFVGAAQADGEAYIAMGGADPSRSLDELASELVQRMRDNASLEPVEESNRRIGDWPTRLVRYEESNGELLLNLYYLFVQAPQHSFLFIGMGLDRHRDALRNSAASLHALSTGERSQIRAPRLRLTVPSEGESLSELSRRSGNAWSSDFTAIANGLEAGELPAAGEPVKITRVEVYTP